LPRQTTARIPKNSGPPTVKRPMIVALAARDRGSRATRRPKSGKIKDSARQAKPR
jgi:hypothetical protein